MRQQVIVETANQVAAAVALPRLLKSCGCLLVMSSAEATQVLKFCLARMVPIPSRQFDVYTFISVVSEVRRS